VTKSSAIWSPALQSTYVVKDSLFGRQDERGFPDTPALPATGRNYRVRAMPLIGVTEAMKIRHDRRSYDQALAECDVLKALSPFHPRIAGTQPLGLDLPGSAAGATLKRNDACSASVGKAFRWQCSPCAGGMKTEPAFAAVLGLAGDPYLALLDLGEQDDETLISVLQAGGFASAGAR
jgi:hypothetical protein